LNPPRIPAAPRDYAAVGKSLMRSDCMSAAPRDYAVVVFEVLESRFVFPEGVKVSFSVSQNAFRYHWRGVRFFPIPKCLSASLVDV